MNKKKRPFYCNPSIGLTLLPHEDEAPRAVAIVTAAAAAAAAAAAGALAILAAAALGGGGRCGGGGATGLLCDEDLAGQAHVRLRLDFVGEVGD